MKRQLVAVICLAALMVFSSCGQVETDRPTIIEGDIMQSLNNGTRIEALARAYKSSENGNPISGQIYCADPTAVEYEGRLYVYGTNDHQQYDAVGEDGKNSYEKIKSLVVFSTEDMINWTYHGTINVGEIAPWIYTSWAPSIVSRVEDDGLTHFYLYFSNSGAGVGVITSTDPVTGWSDPLGHPLVSHATDGLGDCPNPFDPGAVIDDDGIGWLSFGAGTAQGGNDYMTGAARIAKLGADMISIEEIAEIPDFYHFEASELNYINGTYLYTYNTSWVERSIWKNESVPAPSACSMAYMTSKTPLDPKSWEYRGHYFLNPGESGESYSNNHTHVHKYKGKYYVFYHTLALQDAKDIHGGFRSLSVEELKLNEKSLEIELTGASKSGAKQIEKLDPYCAHAGAEMSTGAGIAFAETVGQLCRVSPKSECAGAWTGLKGVKLSGGKGLYATVSGKGRIELRVGSADGETAAAIDFECDEPTTHHADIDVKLSGTKDIYFVFSDADIVLYAWEMQK